MLPIAILAGGLAKRLRPLTETIPKSLIEINGEPFLAHQLRLLRANGIERVVLCAGFLGEQIRAYAGDGSAFGLDLDYSFDGAEPLGTGGALRRALPLLGEAFLVVYGDAYLPCDYPAAEHAFLNSEKLGFMSVFRNDGQWDTSNVEYSAGRILAYNKVDRTPRMCHIDYGLGAFRRAAFDAVPEDRPLDLAVLYQDLLQRGELAAWEANQRFYEIGSHEGIRELGDFLSR
jgi:NDP-sugar pyrophosphorylase family protein